MAVDPTDSVRRLLERASEPLSTQELVERLKSIHDEREVVLALDFWRRERHDAIEDADGNWSWQAQPPRSA